MEELEKLSQLGRFSEFYSDDSDDDDSDEDDSDVDGHDASDREASDRDAKDSDSSDSDASGRDSYGADSYGGREDRFASDLDASELSFSGALSTTDDAPSHTDGNTSLDDTDSEVSDHADDEDDVAPSRPLSPPSEDNQVEAFMLKQVDDASACETAPSSSTSTLASFESSPAPTDETAYSVSNNYDDRESTTSDFVRPSSPFEPSPSYRRNSFDSGTPRSSAMSSNLARESYGQLLFEAINTVPKAPVETEVPDEPQYFDTDSERGSTGETDDVSRGDAQNDDDDDDGIARHTYVKDDAPKSGGRRWGRPNLLNKLASAHVFEKKSSSSKASSSNTSSAAETDVHDDVQSKPKTTALGAVAAKLARKASSATTGTRTFSMSQNAPLPSNRLRKASSGASVESDALESVVYSPTGDDAKATGKSKFTFFRSNTTAASAAPPTAPKPAATAFTKRFGWKKSAAAADKS